MSGFYQNKTVLVTGHTGFKGAWLCKVLSLWGAKVVGYALEPPTQPSLFEIARLGGCMTSVTGDVRNFEKLRDTVARCRPQIVFHLAAQPIVRAGYRDPLRTYGTNVMGTVHLLEAVRQCASVRSVVNVTTDKVYENKEWVWGYRETDRLDGYDPYANSKSCSELVTETYRRSYAEMAVVSTCRAGNVIGGGDFAPDRILPDCVRAAHAGKKAVLRNPRSVRPYQHVLEALSAYLLVAQKQYEEPEKYRGAYNIGPDANGCVTAAALATLFCREWGGGAGWEDVSETDAPHEAGLLTLDCSKIKQVLGWAPRWDIAQAVRETVAWSKAYYRGDDMDGIMRRQIERYFGGSDGF